MGRHSRCRDGSRRDDYRSESEQPTYGCRRSARIASPVRHGREILKPTAGDRTASATPKIHFTAAVERASRGDVGTALNIDQLRAVFDSVDRLQLLMVLIDSLPQPEDGCFEIDTETEQGASFIELLSMASASVNAAGFVLRKSRFLLRPNTYANRYTKLKG
jgi:hypothetical protein